MESHSAANNGVRELDITEGLKQLLTDAGFTIESVVNLGYQKISEMLNIDQCVGKLIIEAAQNVMQVRNRTKILNS